MDLSMFVFLSIFVPQSKAILVNGTTVKTESILNRFYTSTDIAQWKFKKTDWLVDATYPVFGEVVVETFCQKGRRLVFEIDVAIHIETTLEISIGTIDFIVNDCEFSILG